MSHENIQIKYQQDSDTYDQNLQDIFSQQDINSPSRSNIYFEYYNDETALKFRSQVKFNSDEIFKVKLDSEEYCGIISNYFKHYEGQICKALNANHDLQRAVKRYIPFKPKYKKSIASHKVALDNTPIHSNTHYLRISQNISRLATSSIKLNYNVTREISDSFANQVVQINREIWPTEKGASKMLELLSKFTLQNDLFGKCAIINILFSKQQLEEIRRDSSNYEQIVKTAIFRHKFSFLKLKIELPCLKEIILQYLTNSFPPQRSIFNQPLELLPQMELNKVAKLSGMIFNNQGDLVYQYPEWKFLCSACLQFNSECQCLRLSPQVAIKYFMRYYEYSNKKQRTLNQQSSVFYRQYGDLRCNDTTCFKMMQCSKQSSKLILEEISDIEMTDDICVMAKKNDLDCVTVKQYFFEKYSAIKKKYYEQLQIKQEQKDDECRSGNGNETMFLFRPCDSHTDCKNCQCENNNKCSNLCACQCKMKHKGCGCTNGCSLNCPCMKNNFECDPTYCKCCSILPYDHGTQFKKVCLNMQILEDHRMVTWIGRSSCCPGLGLFAKYFIPTGQLINIYIGEILSEDESDVRDQFESDETFYSYQLNDPAQVIEARQCGNEARFINHSYKPNCEAKLVYAAGNCHQAIYAIKEIEPGQELFLNYDAAEIINKDQYPWLTSQKRYFNVKSKYVIANS